MRFAIILLVVGLCLVHAEEEEDPCYDSNATLKECRNLCQPTCENPEGTDGCGDECVPGCDCNEGYVYFEYMCIPKDECITCDAPNTIYTTCASNCPLTCANPVEGMCVGMCVEGCTCKSGYVLNDDGQCVLLEEC